MQLNKWQHLWVASVHYWSCRYPLVSLCVPMYIISNRSLSENGMFNAILSFPKDYPMMPPKMKFTTEIWHPNGKSRAVRCCAWTHRLLQCTLTVLSAFPSFMHRTVKTGKQAIRLMSAGSLSTPSNPLSFRLFPCWLGRTWSPLQTSMLRYAFGEIFFSLCFVRVVILGLLCWCALSSI